MLIVFANNPYRNRARPSPDCVPVPTVAPILRGGGCHRLTSVFYGLRLLRYRCLSVVSWRCRPPFPRRIWGGVFLIERVTPKPRPHLCQRVRLFLDLRDFAARCPLAYATFNRALSALCGACLCPLIRTYYRLFPACYWCITSTPL